MTKFNIYTSTYHSFQYGSCFSKDYISKAKLFENGFTALTKEGCFYVVRNFKEPVSVLFYDVKGKLGIDPTSITDFLFISPSNSKYGRLELVFTSSALHGIINIVEQDMPQVKEIIISQPITSQPNQMPPIIEGVYHIRSNKRLDYKPNAGTDGFGSTDMGFISAIAESPDKKQIAFYRKEDPKYQNAVFIFTWSLDEFDRIVLSFGIDRFSKIEPKEKIEIPACLSFKPDSQFLWCGLTGLCICSQRYICLVNIATQALFKFKMTTSPLKKIDAQFMHCLTEGDGLRVLMHKEIFFINQVSNELMDACYITSEAAAKKLIVAYNSSEEKNPECDQQIRELMNDNYDLGDAVMMLVKASAHLWKCDIQKILLSAANYGKVFLSKDVFNYHEFLYICRDIRILNNLRRAGNPRFITFEEYRNMSHDVLLKRVMNMQEFFIADNISKQLKLKSRKVYQKWAITQIKAIPKGISSDEEEKYYHIIQKKIAEIDDISYIKIAKKAFKYNRDIIGFRFLENEKSSLIKIPQYMQMKKWEKALELTIETYDPNMLFTVIDVIYRLENITSFCAIISPYKKIYPIVFDYLKKYHESDYVFFLEKHEYYEEVFYYYIEEYFRSSSIMDRNTNLQLARDYKKKIVTLKDSPIDPKFYNTFLDDLESSQKMKKELLKKDIIKQTTISTYDNSTFEVYSSIIENSSDGEIDSKYRKFDIYPKSIAVLKLRVLAKSKAYKVIQTVVKDEVKKENLSNINLGEFYIEIGDTNKALDSLKMAMKPDLFDYKLELLILIEYVILYFMINYYRKYQEALECVIGDRDYDTKARKVNEILLKAPMLRDSVNVLCKKYKVTL